VDVDGRDLSAGCDLRRADVVALLHRQPVRVEQVGDDEGGNGVQHDRADHLADSAGDLEQRCDARPRRADDHRDDDGDEDPEEAGQRGHEPGTRDGGRQHRGQSVLAVNADVEQVHLEADGDGDGSQVIRRRLVDGADDHPAAVEGVHHRVVGLERVVPGDQQDDRGDDEGDDESAHRRRRAEQQSTSRPSPHQATWPSLPPVIAMPSWSGVTDRGS
jgi:hypothetical protein